MSIGALLFLCAAGFIGALVDAIVGGGGLITIPALLAVGLPTHMALGTNKFGSSLGTIASAYHYYKGGKVNTKLIKKLVPFSALGAMIGVSTVMLISPDFLKKLIIVLVFVIGGYTLFKKELGMESKFSGFTKKSIACGMAMALIIGFYDGFFGPGTGSFLIISLIGLYGFDFLQASANTKLLNLTSNLVALSLFILHGKVVFSIGIPMALAMIAGAKVGAHIAIKGGSRYVKPAFVAMTFLLAVKMTYESFF